MEIVTGSCGEGYPTAPLLEGTVVLLVTDLLEASDLVPFAEMSL